MVVMGPGLRVGDECVESGDEPVVARCLVDPAALLGVVGQCLCVDSLGGDGKR
jgi:hypothetical protein